MAEPVVAEPAAEVATGGAPPSPSELFSYVIVDKTETHRDIECPVCFLFMVEPQQTPCAHFFCKHCIETHIATNGATCPTCRSVVELSQLSLCVPYDRQANRLRVSCPNRRGGAGCMWEGERGSQTDHLNATCEWFLCPNANLACEWHGRKKDVEQHATVECRYVPVPCPNDCGVQLPRMQHAEHLSPERGECSVLRARMEYDALVSAAAQATQHRLRVAAEESARDAERARTNPPSDSVVALSLGGGVRQLSVPASVLLRYDSMLTDMFQSDRLPVHYDTNGAAFLDCQPEPFEHIVAWLRASEQQPSSSALPVDAAARQAMLDTARQLRMHALVVVLEAAAAEAAAAATAAAAAASSSSSSSSSTTAEGATVTASLASAAAGPSASAAAGPSAAADAAAAVVLAEPGMMPRRAAACKVRRQRMTQAQFNMCVELARGGGRVVVRSRDLSCLYLAGTSLDNAVLSDSSLWGANMAYTSLPNADLSECDLRTASLQNAVLTAANLSDADLRGADLSTANLSGAKLDGAVLCGAFLGGATLTNVSAFNITNVSLSTGALPALLALPTTRYFGSPITPGLLALGDQLSALTNMFATTPTSLALLTSSAGAPLARASFCGAVGAKGPFLVVISAKTSGHRFGCFIDAVFPAAGHNVPVSLLNGASFGFAFGTAAAPVCAKFALKGTMVRANNQGLFIEEKSESVHEKCIRLDEDVSQFVYSPRLTPLCAGYTLANVGVDAFTGTADGVFEVGHVDVFQVRFQ